MTLVLTPETVAEIAAYNAGVRKARNAYQADPTAYGDLLARVCFPCREHRHFRCTGYVRGHSRCFCALDDHEEMP